jgi:hypothetical protein
VGNFTIDNQPFPEETKVCRGESNVRGEHIVFMIWIKGNRRGGRRERRRIGKVRRRSKVGKHSNRV